MIAFRTLKPTMLETDVRMRMLGFLAAPAMDRLQADQLRSSATNRQDPLVA
jgi:hypothetical protein